MAYQQSSQSLQSQLMQYQQLLERQNRKVESVVSDQPIVGLRVWKVIDDRGLPKLRSVYKETVWPYRKALEKDILNNMGIHAVKPGVRSPSIADPAGVMNSADVLSLFSSYEADVAGEVYLWGRVDEHTDGYLAEFAYPKRLYPHSDFDPVIAMQLEDEYGVPCEYREEFRKPKQQQTQAPYPPGLMTTTTSGFQQMQQAYQGLQQLQQQNVQSALTNAMLYGSGFLKGPYGF